MDVDELVGSAQGTVWGTALRSDRDGYVPPGVTEWPPGKPPVEYFDETEQPHFMGIGLDRAMKVKVGTGVETNSLSRTPIDEKRQRIMQDGQTGHIYAEESYPNIIFVTNNRLLILVGKNSGYLDIEFRYDDDDVTALSISKGSLMSHTTSEIEADGIVYDLSVQVHRKERGQAYQYLHEQTPLIVPKLEAETAATEDSEEKGCSETADVTLTNLISLTPEGFEAYVADVWQERGYSCELTKGSGDAGIDVVAKKTGKRELIQAKRYSEQSVGIDTVQRTAGLLVDNEFDASKVIIVTTSDFTADAERRAQQIDDLDLIDGRELVELGSNAGIDITDSEGEQIYPRETEIEDILALLNPGEPLTTEEIISELNATPKSVVGLLEELHDEEKIRVKKINEKQVIWFKKSS